MISGVKARAAKNMAALWLALGLCCPNLTSTTVIVFVRPDRIVIAADAKSRIFKKNGGYRTPQICKIYQSGSSFVTFIGMDEDDDIGFTSSDIAERNIMLTVKGHADAFVADATGPLLQSMQRAYQKAPLGQYKAVFGARSPLQAIFVGIENGRSAFEAVNMVKVEDAHGRPIRIESERTDCPGNSCPTTKEAGVLWGGFVEAAQAEYKRMKATHDPRLGDDAATLRHLVETEITARPDWVGPPVAVLMIDASGGHWIVDGKCRPSAEKSKAQSKPQNPTKPH
jgi:hypothetical protein